MRRSHAHKVDGNQGALIDAAEGVGCDVVNLSALGRGVPDLVVLWRGKGWLIEVKTKGEKLTPAEEAYALRSRTPIHRIETVDELLRLIGAIA